MRLVQILRCDYLDLRMTIVLVSGTWHTLMTQSEYLKTLVAAALRGAVAAMVSFARQ